MVEIMEIATPSSVMEQIKGFFEHTTVVVDEEKGNVLDDLSVSTWRGALRREISNIPQDVENHEEKYDTNYAWYWIFLSSQWEKIPASVKSVIAGAPSRVESANDEELSNDDKDSFEDTRSQAKLYELLTSLANALTHQDRPTLNDLRELMEEKGIFEKSNWGEEGDEKNEKKIQILFIAVGWLTMLFEPTLSPKSGKLTIQAPRDAKEQILPTEIFDTLSAPIYEARDLPIHQMIKHFGRLIPTDSLTQGRHRNTGLGSRSADTFSEQIVVSCVNYRTLFKIAGVKVEFTSSAALHLDFDERSRCLKVFRFPSWCLIVAGGIGSLETNDEGVHWTYLNRLFIDYLQGNLVEDFDSATDHPTSLPTTTHDIRSFYLEILLSYRLIFGQDPGSYKLFQSHYKNVTYQDPLLKRLCGRNCRREESYDMNYIQMPKSQYSVRVEFPFLGGRLVSLQRFVIEQDPGDLWTLWYDKRDILRHYTFWAVVWVGLASLFLSLTQNIIGIFQVLPQGHSTTTGG